MSYVSRTLGPKESVRFSTGFHWLYWLGAALLAGPFFSVLLVTIPYSAWDLLLLALLAVPFWYGFLRILDGIALEVAVTSDRFVRKAGLIAVTTEEVSLDKIEEVNVDESILGRIFGYGSVHVHGTGAGRIKVVMVADPERLRREIQTARESLKNKGE
jgi:uncharacterized membrane protein YdbT with pleckstrin-like domain